ncbi:MAG: hypothetical protein JXJ20_11330 [Anaerolineae bacterium]|jgi:hypothetical protein|nr:hypothetical protein [Anaerolineae bacterium]
MGFLRKIFGGGQSGGGSSGKKPKFVSKTKRGNNTYEVYKGTDAESARAFLKTKTVTQPLYYVVVETPSEGNWGMDKEGLYLERLLPWQTDLSKATVTGACNLVPDMFSLQMAARGINDNFINTIQCGSCEHEWQDGLRYQKTTVVRCPKCKTYNKIDTSHINVILVG